METESCSVAGAGATRTSALATHRASAAWPCHRHSRVLLRVQL